MNKFYLLLATMLFFVSCSTDDTILTEEQNILTANDTEASYQMRLGKNSDDSCFNFVSGTLSIDMSGGLNNQVLNFGLKAIDLNKPNKPYVVEVHLQPIDDCEDLNSDIGSPTIIALPNVITSATNIPAIEVNPSQLPSVCFKWKVVIHTAKGYYPSCSSSSDWYDAPVL
ncbi:hypothetical protein DVK85_01105 [Flavobacterium arcticum]|uniref:Lipoprotein n=1 Tax=Flavobacterium arcticum TaxID=1784713 RepID=A0A345H8J1_9FLAO|nr:hypothetical protein [Flavobacterium arcticum]AXG72901.1 hypothetical protein DVK85_01105 [Flavobacterium arcticum]KAF2510434.1 hypothetical protein E0W72_08100 [Flavobacterium arcticum]